MARADWLSRSIDDLLPKMDRGSNRDHQKLVTMLIGHEIHLKSVERIEAAELRLATSANDRRASSAAWLQGARSARTAAVSKAGFAQDLAISSGYFGDQEPKLAGPGVGVAEPIAPERVRAFGRPTSFLGVLPGIDGAARNPSFSLESTRWPDNRDASPKEISIGVFALLAAALFSGLFRQGIRATSFALTIAIALAGFVGGPVPFVGAFVLAALGWTGSRFRSAALR
jgi:hypothetical protein